MNPEILIPVLSYAILALQITLIGAGILYITNRVRGEKTSNKYLVKASNLLDRYILHASLLIALTATSGSLYMSNILGWTPCHLCWLQRIFMYPLVILIGVGLLLEKEDVHDYVMPLAMIGGSISVYHYAVQIIGKLSSSCSTLAVSCSDKYTYYFGYITIPMMALTAFVAILALMWKYSR